MKLVAHSIQLSKIPRNKGIKEGKNNGVIRDPLQNKANFSQKKLQFKINKNKNI